MTTLRLVAKLQEPRIWTYLQFLKVHRSTFGQTDLTFRRERGEKKRSTCGGKEGYEWRGNRLLYMTWRENKGFHWTVLTVTSTHFNRLQIFGRTSLTAQFSESDFYLFDLCAVILNVVEIVTFHMPSDGRSSRREGMTAAYPLCGWCYTCVPFTFKLLPPASSGYKFRESHKKTNKGIVGPIHSPSDFI